jgi:thioesterase domain-containing protein
MSSRASQIITIHRSTAPEAKSMFCFPGAADSVTSFLPLSGCLGTSFTIYGIQGRGLDGTAAPHASVEQAVLDNIDAIGETGRGKPYSLLGHSFGGWIAFETARELSIRGTELNTVVLLDTDPPAVGDSKFRRPSRLDAVMELIRNLEDKAGQSLNLGRTQIAEAGRDQQVLMLMKGMKNVGLFPRAASAESVARVLEVFEANLNTRYAPPGPLAGDVLLIYPSLPQLLAGDEVGKDPLRAKRDCDELAFQAWQGFARRVKRIDVPGTHMSMLSNPYIVRVAEEIRRVWGG